MTTQNQIAIPDKTLLDKFIAIVGEQNALVQSHDQAPYLREWRDRYIGKTPMVLRPANTQEVSEILKLANTHNVAVVPQGGNTGLVGGQIPSEDGNEIVISTTRLNDIRSLDKEGRTLTVGAGVTLAEAQHQAESIDCLFPLSLAAEGSCQIGGNLATNAGGVNVLAYGSMRHLTLGLEVVLADGQIWNGLRTLKKDNTGYDLRDLFIGSEGTLGIITAAALKLFPKPAEKATAILGLNTLEQTAKLFRLASEKSADLVTSFEFFPHIAMQFVSTHIANAKSPLNGEHAWYVLIETSRGQNDSRAITNLEALLSEAFESGIVLDATIAQSQAQSAHFWRLRESISEAQKPEGGSIKHDVSVPIAMIPEFILQANKLIKSLIPDARPVPFGHFGDGNIHYNISQPENGEKQAFLAQWENISLSVHDLVSDMGGSISAEHGIGRMKRHEMSRHKSPVELQLMRSIKSALDPKGILNPGKVL